MTTGVVVLARMGSTRLPRKMCADVAGVPLLRRLFDRVAPARADRRVLATTCAPANDELRDLAQAAGWATYRGSEEDVIERLTGACQTFAIDAVVVVEADELFSDAEQIDQALAALRGGGVDAVKFKDVPIGSWVVGVMRRALEAVWTARAYKTTEAWSRLFMDGDLPSRWLELEPPLPPFDPALRLTIDYAEDLELARRLYGLLGADAGLRRVIHACQEQPELVQINASLNDAYWARLASRVEGSSGAVS